MFLDMACFFRGYHKTYVLSILESSYNIGAECGLEVLIGKSLVLISGDDRLEMHDLIEVMLNNTVSRLNNFELQLPGPSETATLPHLEHFQCLRRLNLSDSQNLMQTPDFSGMPNLEHLYLLSCESLKELHYSLGNSRKLIRLDLWDCESLKRFPCVSGESLEYLNMWNCSSLEIFPEVKPSSIQYLIRGELLLSRMKNLVALPSSICKLKCMVRLDVSDCSKFESLPEEIGDLENLEDLDATRTLIARPPSSIVRFNKLKFLSFKKRKWKRGPIEYLFQGVLFVFPRVNKGLRSLKILNLCHCNLIDGELPDDIGCLSSLKKLDLSGNNFEHLPRSIAQLGALRCLDHGISASDSLSLRVITSWRWNGMPRFPYQGIGLHSVILPKNWYIHDSFLGFAMNPSMPFPLFSFSCRKNNEERCALVFGLLEGDDSTGYGAVKVFRGHYPRCKGLENGNNNNNKAVDDHGKKWNNLQQLQLVDAILHYATSRVIPQQNIDEIRISFDVLKNRTPCNFLVFGLGHDSQMWASFNSLGNTLFLEEDPKWVQTILKDAPFLHAETVKYRTMLSEADELVEHYRKEPDCSAKKSFLRGNHGCKLALDMLPDEVYHKEWDVIMIDAPRGYFAEAPGRMAAIYSAAVMARNRPKGKGVTHVFLHDVDRKVEKIYAELFLCRKYLVKGVGRIWHFEIPPPSNVGNNFC
ncbi:TMV resistance protein N [Capsicum chinense]|nr:TMV resistance protein N [Capsicum chinense]